MDSAQMSDLMVRLAAVGCSGVAIFAIFWMGIIISRLEKGTDPEKYKTIRFYMGTCVVAVAVSGFSGYKNFEIKAADVNNAQDANKALLLSIAKEKRIVPATAKMLQPSSEAKLKTELSKTLDKKSVDNILKVYKKQ